jgi:predicted ArsR family transcriptional regulator
MGAVQGRAWEQSALTGLADPIRRRLFRLAAASPTGVSRDEAANELGIARSVAAFHLDKLAELGLLGVEFRRPPGRSGPGAGRPAKHYLPLGSDVSLTVPARRYDVAARVLVDAISCAHETGAAILDVLPAVATACGRELATSLVAASTSEATEGARVADVLELLGYEPREEDGDLVLANCPFHTLADRRRALVCGMNVDLVRGILEELGAAEQTAVFDPSPGRCCVRVRRHAPSGRAERQDVT